MCGFCVVFLWCGCGGLVVNRGQLSLLKRRVKNMPRFKDLFSRDLFFCSFGRACELDDEVEEGAELGGGKVAGGVKGI